jgi:trimethylamine:corrinoid methyltransferase-like protein
VKASVRLNKRQRAYERWNKVLAEYQMRAIDPAVDEVFKECIHKRKASMPDARYSGMSFLLAVFLLSL